MSISTTDIITISTLLNVVTTLTGVLDKEAALGEASLVTPENVANLNFTVQNSLISLDSIVNPSPNVNSLETTLTGFTYVEGAGPSTSQSLIVSASNVIADVTVTAPTDYEISIVAGSGYTSSLTFTQADYTVVPATVYVRLKSGLSAATYNEIITISSDGLDDVTVSVEGTVTAP